MPALSPRAADILEQMQPDLGYQTSDLLQFAPELCVEALREVMRELWIERQVERVGYSGWRRVRRTGDSRNGSGALSTGPIETVKPEDLFDHDAFTGIFK